jgi:signal transduction histidine kinase/DNA-binding response OmpR family regulator
MISTESFKTTRARLAQLRTVLFTAALMAFGIFALYTALIDRKPIGEVLQSAVAFLAVTMVVIWIAFYFVGLALDGLGRSLVSVSRQNQRLAALQRISHALNATLDLDPLLNLVLREAATTNNALCGQVLLARSDGTLDVAARYAAPDTPQQPSGLVVRAARSGRAQVAPELSGDIEYAPLHPQARSAIAVPILRNEKAIGVLQLESAQSRAFAPGAEDELLALVEQAAVAINNARIFAALERQLGESAMLVEVARTVNSSPNLIEVLQASVAMLVNTLNYPRAAIYLREGEMLFLAAQSGFDPQRLPLRTELARGIIGRAVRSARTQFVRDATADPDYQRYADDTYFEIAMPLLNEGQVVGVINVESSAKRVLEEEDVDLLSHVGPQVSVAIENARLHMDQSRRLRVMSLLYENTLDLMTELDLTRLMHTLAERAANLTGATTAVVYLYRPEERVLEMGAAHGLPSHLAATSLQAGEGVSGRVVVTSQSLVVDDYAHWGGRSSAFAGAGFNAVAGVPMRARGAVLGVITVANLGSSTRFTPDLIQMLELFANQAAAALSNAQLYLAEQQRRRTSDALREVGRVVSSSLDLAEVLQLILQQLENVLAYDSSTIMLGDGERLRITACRGFDEPEHVIGVLFSREDSGLLFAVLDSEEPRVIADLHDEPQWPRRSSDTGELRDVRAWIGIPLVAQNSVVGLLTVDSYDPGFYRLEDGRIAQAFADQAAIAIRNARLYEETQTKLTELSLLYEAAMASTSAASLDEILQIIVARVRDALSISHVAILLIDPDEQVLEFRAAVGFPPDMLASVHPQLGEGLSGYVAQSGRPYLVTDVAREEHYLSVDPAVRSAMGVPLALGSQVIGVMLAESTRPAAFDEADLRLISTMAGQLAAVISNAQLVDVLVASQQQLAERNRALQEANLRLQELDRLKSQFLANMSHELRTPLNSIIGFAEVLADGLAGALNADQQEYVTYIHNSGRHLLNLINDVLDLSKIDAGKTKLDVRLFQLPEIFSQMQTSFAPLIARRRQELVIDLAPDVPAINGDAFRIKQVLLNLLSNAHKFTPDGGRITLTARLRDPDTVQLSVRDTGPGIKPEYQDVIFEEFRQADSGLTREFEGTGLGLAICKRLVELHGGQIWVESEYGQGATFHMVLPVAGPGGVARRGEQANRTALVVEDDQQFAHLLSLHLRQAGYEPVTVASGADALSSALRLHPALITLDVMLPDLSGWSVLQTLKSEPAMRDIPVLVITIIDDPERALSLGAVDYLVKPIERAGLMAALDRLRPVREPATGPLDVLLVDDDPAIGEVIGAMLAGEHYRLRQALSAGEALRLVGEHRPGLAIVDPLLPNGDGKHILELLRGSDAQADVPVILLTDQVISEDERARLTDQIRAIMSKSTFTRDQLLAEVQKLERLYQRERASRGPVRIS